MQAILTLKALSHTEKVWYSAQQTQIGAETCRLTTLRMPNCALHCRAATICGSAYRQTVFGSRALDVVPALSDWRELARCVAPEVHALPLTEGWDTFGGTCCYYKTQENVVTVSIRAKHSTSFTGTSRELICNLPAGFRPSDWVSGTCALDIGDSGGSYHGGIHIDATGGVYINGFATYATVYAQISFVAAS